MWEWRGHAVAKQTYMKTAYACFFWPAMLMIVFNNWLRIHTCMHMNADNCCWLSVKWRSFDSKLCDLFLPRCTPVEFVSPALFQIDGPKVCDKLHVDTDGARLYSSIQELAIWFHRTSTRRFEMNIISLRKPMRWVRWCNITCTTHLYWP